MSAAARDRRAAALQVWLRDLSKPPPQAAQRR
jgi:hypothetical protein